MASNVSGNKSGCSGEKNGEKKSTTTKKYVAVRWNEDDNIFYEVIPSSWYQSKTVGGKTFRCIWWPSRDAEGKRKKCVPPPADGKNWELIKTGVRRFATGDDQYLLKTVLHRKMNMASGEESFLSQSEPEREGPHNEKVVQAKGKENLEPRKSRAVTPPPPPPPKQTKTDNDCDYAASSPEYSPQKSPMASPEVSPPRQRHRTPEPTQSPRRSRSRSKSSSRDSSPNSTTHSTEVENTGRPSRGRANFQEMPMEDFQYRVLMMLGGVQQRLDGLQKELKQLGQRVEGESSPLLLDPVKSVEEFDEVERGLEDKETKKRMVARLSKAGGKDVSACITNCLNLVMVEDIQALFNKEGHNGKRAFGHTRMFKCMTTAINESSGHSEDAVKRNIGAVLKRKKTAEQKEEEKEKRKEKDRNQRQ